MPVITSENAEQWKLDELARRSGKKPEKQTNPFMGFDKDQIKEQRTLLREAKKAIKKSKAD